ncbi:hypothetical protein AB0O50_08860 [Streptomyces cyaneofuscatus]|uniref:hypothetical protein n=1 Tax=Streptomyces cyaneofuscatus TaxID=66883 RepID=UPI00343E2F9C
MPENTTPNPAPNGPDKPTGEGDPAPVGNERQGEPTGTQPEGDQGEPSADLSAERTARTAAEKRAEAAEAEAARLRRSNAATKGTDLDALRAEIREEFTGQLVRAEIRAAAAGRLRDPADALALVDVAGLVGESGDVNTAAVTAALDKLVADKPYLAAPVAETPAPVWGDVGAGQHGSAEGTEDEPATPLDRLRSAYTTTV